jgi:hypothetical protein
MRSVSQAYIDVKRRGWRNYEATVIARPDDDGDSPFQMPLMEQGPYRGRSHKSAWQKAWRAVGCPNIVELDEL